jgi:hypothetical protein
MTVDIAVDIPRLSVQQFYLLVSSRCQKSPISRDIHAVDIPGDLFQNMSFLLLFLLRGGGILRLGALVVRL